MGYDIYGNHLRRGYCEVHPDVAEEYPCSFCYESYREEEPRQDPMDKAYQEYYYNEMYIYQFMRFECNHMWG